MLWTSPLIALLVGGILYSIYLRSTRKRRLSPPPGPRPLPIIGNLFDIPKTSPWIVYRDWCQEYGSLISLEVLGRTLVVIGDYETAIDLLEKRSTKYGSRPEFKMAQMTGWEWNFVFSPYGKFWKDSRKVFWQYFRPDAVTQHQSHQHDAVNKLLYRLHSGPDRIDEHLRYALGVAILGSAYGLEIADKNDEVLACCETALQSVEYLISNSSLIEYFPFLAWLPTWLPGTGFLRHLAELRRAALAMRDMPWSRAKERMNAGKCPECISRKILEELAQLDDQAALDGECVAQAFLGTVYAAGLDTQYATLQRFFLAMALYPDVQRKAHAELDAVVGKHRLPDFTDREDLPYVTAIVKETLRWYGSTPVGVAHCTTEDDEYNGYFIPKNATVLVNSWAIANDADVYPEPQHFVPDRFLKDGKLNPDVRDPATTVFGFGRRICPGRHFAEKTMFLLIASVLSAFDITLPVDADGRPIDIRPRQTTGIISYLEDWKCLVKPRFAHSDECEQAVEGEVSSC